MNDRRFPLAIGITLGVILSLVFVAGFAAGAVVQSSRSAPSLSSSDTNLNDFLTAYRLVTERSYFRPFDRKHLVDAAIDGMMSATGDPHTIFLSPSENQVANTVLNGSEFSGIGAIVMPLHKNLQVVWPVPKSPAALAGMHAGDVVTRIDGRGVSQMASSNAISRIHGPAGSQVSLTVIRGNGHPFIVHVRRGKIPPITAYPRIVGNNDGLILISSFSDTTSSEVSDSVAYLTSRHVRALILDLRENPGGFVDSAQHVVSQFLSRGVIAYEETTDKQLHPLPVVSGLPVTRLPMAILVDAGTASAAEITAAALRDNGRAVLVGSQTYGKGSMQSVYALDDGSSIHITDRLWLTPKKKSIQKVGIRPDISVDALSAQGSPGSDPQLSAAERYLAKHPTT